MRSSLPSTLLVRAGRSGRTGRGADGVLRPPPAARGRYNGGALGAHWPSGAGARQCAGAVAVAGGRDFPAALAAG